MVGKPETIKLPIGENTYITQIPRDKIFVMTTRIKRLANYENRKARK